MAEKKLKFPKELGACADLLFVLKSQRLEAQRIAQDFEAQEKALKEHIINTLPKSSTGASGKTHRVSVVTRTVPQVQDWTKVYAYIKKTGNFQLLQRRLAENAVDELWEANKTIPGVNPFTVVSVSLTKV